MKLLEQIEAMRARMNELATGEQAIIKTLGEALAAVDQRLLEDVRHVSAAHEARRGAILRELKVLAERMGALHQPHVPVTAALEDPSVVEPLKPSENAESHFNGGGDWRQAAANMRDELDRHFKAQPQISHAGH
jgi:hypothetical protein